MDRVAWIAQDAAWGAYELVSGHPDAMTPLWSEQAGAEGAISVGES